MLPLGGDLALLRIFDSTAYDVETAESYYDVAGAAAWTWARFDVSTSSLTEAPELPLGVVPSTSFTVGDDQYVGVTEGDFSGTTFTRVTADGSEPGVTLPGFPISLISL